MGQFAADTFAGLAAGQSLLGSTASGGGQWSSRSPEYKSTGAGVIYPDRDWLFPIYLGSPSPLGNQVLAFSFVVPSGGVDTGGNYQVQYGCKFYDGSVGTRFYVYMQFVPGVGSLLGLAELDAVGGFSNTFDAGVGSSFNPTGDVHCVLTLSKGVATLVATGGHSQTLSMPLTLTAASKGSVFLSTFTTGAGNTSTVGWQFGPFVASTIAAPATGYGIVRGSNIQGAAPPIVQSPGYPNGVPLQYSGLSINNLNVSNSDYAPGNRFHALCLDGVAPAGGFTWTPTSGLVIDESTKSTASSPSITVPAGSDLALFAWVPPDDPTAVATPTTLALAGTNDRGFADPAGLSVPTRPKLCLLEGDSILDPGFGSPFPGDLQADLGTGWLVQSAAVAFSAADNGAAFDDLNVSHRVTKTIAPWHDAGRKQEACVVWCGTNDLANGRTTTQTQAALSAIVASLKAGGWANIAVGTIVSRAPGESFWSLASVVNTWIRSQWGPTGSDPSVAVLDFASDAVLGSQDGYSNAAYYGDGVHPFGASAIAAIRAIISGWVLSLPDAQAQAGRLRRVRLDGGMSTLSGV